MGLSSRQYFEAGQVRAAQDLLAAQLRTSPDDARARSFLFNLLCFSGDWERARKHLAILAGTDEGTRMGSLLYLSALNAETQREQMIRERAFPNTPVKSKLSGRLNGDPFSEILDADPDLGARLEIFVAGSCLWIPFEWIESVRIEAPSQLTDTIWAQGFVTIRKSSERGSDIGEALLPVMYPFSFRHSDENVWLGRRTAWGRDENGTEFPVGQRILMVDGEEKAFLDVRTIEFDPLPEA
jgi:type VI secretion system protein ImpE